MRFVPLVDLATPDGIGHVNVHTWLPIGTTEGGKQFVLPALPKGVVCVCQQLCMSHEYWYIYPMLGQGGHGWEKDL